jgi:hypothetical protein
MSKIPNFEKFDVNEAIVAAGFGMNNMQNFGLGGGTPQTGYSMGAIAGTVGTSATAIGNQANEYEMNENDDHTASGYIAEAKKHVNESIDKAYESCKSIDESVIAEARNTSELEKYVKSKYKDQRVNPVTFEEVLEPLAIHIDSYTGVSAGDLDYTAPTITAFKKLVDSMAKAHIDGSDINEASVQIAGNKKPSGAKILATVIIDYLEAEGYFKPGFKNVKKDITSDVQELIIKSTF